jgi:hemerythrin
MLGIKSTDSHESPRCLLSDVGLAKLNQQHLRLASYAVEFQQIVAELAEREPSHEDWKHIDALFSRIIRYVAEHFRDEEALMVAHHYPDYASHKKMHDKFVEEMARIQSQINNRNVKFKGKLKTLLWSWLYGHINEVDFKYRDFFLSKGLK